MEDRYLIARVEGGETPFIKVFEITGSDGRRNIYLAFLGTHHHYSLHELKIITETAEHFTVRQDNQEIEYPKHYTGSKPIIYTSFDIEKESSVWDSEIEGVATLLDLPDPQKHIKYYENRPLPLGSMDSFPLGGRRIDLGKIKRKKNYPADQSLFIDVTTDSFFIETRIFPKKPEKSKGILCKTSLGWFQFEIR